MLELKPVIEHVIMTCGGRASAPPSPPPIRGWPHNSFGAYATTVSAPPQEVRKKAFSKYAKWLFGEGGLRASDTGTYLYASDMRGPPYLYSNEMRGISVYFMGELLASWPGYLIITTDGRAIALSAYDFWNRKGVTLARAEIERARTIGQVSVPVLQKLQSSVQLWGDFTVRLLQHPKVAEVHDLPPTTPEGTIRAYSEEDVNLLLEHPELRLMEVASLVQTVQQINALRAQLAELRAEKAKLEEEMARLAKEYAVGAYEYRAATEEEKQNFQRLKELTERELALQAQVSQLQAELERARQAQAVQAAQPSKTIWLLVGAGAILLLLLMRR